MDTLPSLISTLGFPVFVAVWLMVRDLYFVRRVEHHLDTVATLLGVIAAQGVKDDGSSRDYQRSAIPGDRR